MAIRDSADRTARRPLGGLDLRAAHLDAGIDDFCHGFNPAGDAARYARRVGYLPAELVCGIGFGCFQSPNNREMLSNVSREQASYASGVLAIMRTFGQCLGAAVMGVLLAKDESAVHLALWIAAAASALSVAVSASRLRKIASPAGA